MLMKELKKKKLISSRLYNHLCFAFRDTPNNRKEYRPMLVGYIWNCTYVGDASCVSEKYLKHYYDTLSFDQKNELMFAYFHKMEQKFANSSLEEVLKELEVSEPEDIMQFANLGKKSVSELRALIEKKGGGKNDSKAI